MNKVISLLILILLCCSKVNAEEQYYKFKLGKQIINQSPITFEFPPQVRFLYLFSDPGWKDFKGDKMRLIVTLYDKQYNKVASSYSVCTEKRQVNAFGSIVFSEVTRSNVDTIAFFTLTTGECSGDIVN